MSKIYINIFLCIVLWALIPVCSKKVLEGMNSFSMLFFSNIISSFAVLVYIFLSKKNYIFRLYNFKNYLYLSFLGILGTFIYYLLLYKAFSLSSAQEIFVINYSWPILVSIFAVMILKEKLSFVKLLSILISFFGVLIIVTKGNPFSFKLTSALGDMLAFFGAVSFALFSVLGKKSRYDNVFAVFVYFFASSIISAFLIPFFRISHIDLSVLFYLLVNGILVNGISYIFWFNALKNRDTHIVANFVYLTPFLSLLFIALFLKEKIHLYSLAALLLIVGGILLQQVNVKKLKI